MKWTPGYRSEDVEDRRGQRAPIGRGLPVGVLQLVGSRFGLGGVIVAVLVFVGIQYVSSSASTTQAVSAQTRGAGDEQAQFISFVLDDAQKTWAHKLPGYRRARLVLFEGGTETGCGYGDRAVGPFYCPADQQVYLDLEFFQTLEQTLGAGGDFAQAYVIAHELGHHVQHQLGTTGRVAKGDNAMSVRLELQADCYAGVWANATAQRNLLEAGDVDEAMRAAASIGDDRLQKMQRGTVRPESFTHGSSAQRKEWFERGYRSGSVERCDTFASP